MSQEDVSVDSIIESMAKDFRKGLGTLEPTLENVKGVLQDCLSASVNHHNNLSEAQVSDDFLRGVVEANVPWLSAVAAILQWIKEGNISENPTE